MNEENAELRRQLNKLIALARSNEEKLRRFNEQELKLIAAGSLPELLRRIVCELPESFGLHQVTLTLLDPEGEFIRLLESRGMREELPQVQLIRGPEPLKCIFPEGNPYLGLFTLRYHAAFFPDVEWRPCSIALLPLVRGGELIGSLNLGSIDPNRYGGDAHSDFLERLAAIVAVCLENCVNHEKLKQLGMTDALTGVNNRRYFEERLAEEMAVAHRTRALLACMFLDVDHFKRFNDTYGHQAGDYVLREVARVARTQLRRSDTLSRYGGEEFVVLLPGITKNAARESAERVRHAVEGSCFLLDTGEAVQVTVSVGVAILDVETDSAGAELLVRAADDAVYAAKRAGRNCVALGALPPRAEPPKNALAADWQNT